MDLAFSVQDLEYYLLILVRVSTFIFAAPFFGTTGVPQRVKIGLSLVLAILLYNGLPVSTLEYNTSLEYAGIIIKEAAIGLILGLVTTICTSIINFAGRFIDMEIGLSMASMFDPMTRETTTISGQMYNYLVLIILIISNFHHYLIRAFADTYTLIPINYADLKLNNVYVVFIKFMTESFLIGFRIVLPVFCVMLVLNVVLGILAKVAPQMNMFAVGLQIKVLVGFGIMFVTIRLIPDMANMIFEEMKTMIVAAIEAMR